VFGIIYDVLRCLGRKNVVFLIDDDRKSIIMLELFEPRNIGFFTRNANKSRIEIESLKRG
jgi:hypothetical protein